MEKNLIFYFLLFAFDLYSWKKYRDRDFLNYAYITATLFIASFYQGLSKIYLHLGEGGRFTEHLVLQGVRFIAILLLIYNLRALFKNSKNAKNC